VEDLRAAVEALRGPLTDRDRARAAAAADRSALWSWCADEAGRVSLGGDHQASALVDSLRAAGIRGGVDVHRARLATLFAVLGTLPAREPVTLAAFAADVLGDPHGLDPDRPAGRLAVDSVARLLGLPNPDDAEAVRAVWERVGVAPDPLSSTVLVLGLRPPGGSPLDRFLRAAADVSEPAVLTLAQLRRWPVAPLPDEPATYVVENPSLVAEAARTGWSGPPLVCSSGRPTVAVVTLLRQLAAAGARCFQHADFDATGIAITTWLAERAGTTPWRMTTDAYRAALVTERPRVPLAGPIPPTPWDPALVDTMGAEGVAVYEEEVRGDLLSAMTAATSI